MLTIPIEKARPMYCRLLWVTPFEWNWGTARVLSIASTAPIGLLMTL